ncbi:MAG: hypothetical protein OXH94_01315, partial [Rhodospirillales bacterium]|nr:hypothetical protein [Rhodospirillales bacterium]
MDGGGSGFDASEIRAEVLRTVSGADERRTGVSDRLSVGRVAAVDLAEGGEEARILGSLSESVGDNRLTLVDVADFKVEGKLKSKSHSDAFMLGGSMVETFAGATLLLAGMSDDMVIGGGSRVTAPLDVTVGGLVGMEEKIGSAFADGFFSENAVVAFDREFGPGVHNCGTVVFEGHVLQTHATGFAPLMQTWLGVRNLNLGSHFSQGGQANSQVAPPPAAPPPVPPKMGGRGMLGALGGPANPASVQNMVAAADAADALEDLGDLGLVAEDTRAASNGAEAEVLADLRRGGEFVDLDGPGGARVAPAYEQTHGINAQTGLPETVTRPHRPELDNSDDDLMNVLSGGLFTSADARHEATGPGMVQPGAVQAPPPRVPSPDPSADAARSVDGEWIETPADGLTEAAEHDPAVKGILKKRDPGAERSPKPNVSYSGADTTFEYEQPFEYEYPGGLPAIASLPDPSAIASNPGQSAELDQAARLDAAEDLRALEDEMLEMEWFRRRVVTADPQKDPRAYTSQMEAFVMARERMRRAYESAEHRDFASLYRQAVAINNDHFYSFLGAGEAERKKAQTLWSKIARKELRAFEEDYVAAAEIFVRHQDLGPGGYARVAELDRMVETPMGAATFSDVSGGALARAIDYLEWANANPGVANPYRRALDPGDVQNGDAYDLLLELLEDISDDGVRIRDGGTDKRLRQQAEAAAEVRRLESELSAYRTTHVDPLETRIEDLQRRIDQQTRKFNRVKTQLGKETAAAKRASLQAELLEANIMLRNIETGELDVMEKRLAKAQKTYRQQFVTRVKFDKLSWSETEQRYEFLIDTLAAAREDILAGRDPNIRLRSQADGYEALSNYTLASKQDANASVGLRVPREDGRKARPKQGDPLPLRDRAILSRLVADALADL